MIQFKGMPCYAFYCFTNFSGYPYEFSFRNALGSSTIRLCPYLTAASWYPKLIHWVEHAHVIIDDVVSLSKLAINWYLTLLLHFIYSTVFV